MERGLDRFVAFVDAVVAIAITLLILPLVDEASKLGNESATQFMDDNGFRLFAFVLSFFVIGRFWWEQHRTLGRLVKYNVLLIWGCFLWLFAIVFLPFPTQLLASRHGGDYASHLLYVGTLVVMTLASLIERLAIAHSPDLLEESQRSEATPASAVIFTVLMIGAFVLAAALPAVGLWGLLLVGLAGPIEHKVTGS